jgi:hypothetical protein
MSKTALLRMKSLILRSILVLSFLPIKNTRLFGQKTDEIRQATQDSTIKRVDSSRNEALFNQSKQLQELETRRVIEHTTVTIGYDTPWRQVHELLINAVAIPPDYLPKDYTAPAFNVKQPPGPANS